MTPDELRKVLSVARECGVTVCADLDEDCAAVENHGTYVPNKGRSMPNVPALGGVALLPGPLLGGFCFGGKRLWRSCQQAAQEVICAPLGYVRGVQVKGSYLGLRVSLLAWFGLGHGRRLGRG